MRCSPVSNMACVVLNILLAVTWSIVGGRVSCCSLSMQTMRRQSSGMRNKQQSQHSTCLTNAVKLYSHLHSASLLNPVDKYSSLFLSPLCPLKTLFNIHFICLHLCVHLSLALLGTFKNILS